MNANPSQPVTSPQRILCLWIPNWPIQRLVVSQPNLRRQRIVLFRQDSRRGRLVSAASPMALREGISLNMPLAEAKSLLTRSAGDFHIFQHDPAVELAALEELADSLENFSPIVGIEQFEPWKHSRSRSGHTAAAGKSPHAGGSGNQNDHQLNSIFLEITGLAHLFGDEHQLAHDLHLHCDNLGYLPRIAIANTVGMAWGAARFASVASSPDLPTSRPPHHPIIIPSHDTHTFSQLPIEALRLTPGTLTTLHQLGIQTIEQLLQLPRPDLARRFGNEIHQRIDQANGQIEEPVIARQPPPAFWTEQLLDYPTCHRETIEVIIARLVNQICDQLRSRQQGALQWTVRLVTQTGPPLQFVVNLFQATATLTQIMPLVEMQLEQILQPHTRKSRAPRRVGTPARHAQVVNEASPDSQPTPAEAPVHFHRTTLHIQEIQVSVTSCVLLVEQQRQLFDENPRLDKQALAQLINRLTSRLGQQHVVYPKLRAGAQPEYAYRFHPLVDIHRKRSRSRNKPVNQSHVAGRPLKIFQPAVPMRSAKRTSSVPLGRDQRKPSVPLGTDECKLNVPLGPGINGNSETEVRKLEPPRILQYADFPAPQEPLTVVRHWGPERIETGWWRGLTVCRDYWRIETDTGQQLWIYRDLRNKQWFLQGEF